MTTSDQSKVLFYQDVKRIFLGHEEMCEECGQKCKGRGRSIIWQYVGEMNSKNLMCGLGTLTYEATNPQNSGTAVQMGYNDYTGTFLDDRFHGIGRQVWEYFVYEGEYKEGKRHGFATVYFNDGKVFNVRYEEGKEIYRKRVTNQRKAWYGDGNILQVTKATSPAS